MSFARRVGTVLVPKVTRLVPRASASFVHQALDKALAGVGPLPSAADTAEKHLSQERGDADKAIHELIETTCATPACRAS